MFRRYLATAAAVWLLVVLAACGGGEEVSASEDSGVRTLADQDSTAEDAEAEDEDVAAEFGLDANEAAAEANAIDGDTDGDGVLSEAEQLELLNSLMLEFSQCIRDGGLETFEDITIEMFAGSDGNGPGVFFQLMLERGLNPGTDEGSELLSSCGSVLGRLAANAPQPSDEQLEAREANAVDWAACMREQGIEDFPDPDFVASPTIGYDGSLQQQFNFGEPPVSDAAAACAAEGRTITGVNS